MITMSVSSQTFPFHIYQAGKISFIFFFEMSKKLGTVITLINSQFQNPRPVELN